MRYIDDHRPLIEDINNTGQEVKVLCHQEEADKVQFLLDKVNSKYDEVKADIRNRFVLYRWEIYMYVMWMWDVIVVMLRHSSDIPC